MTTHDGPWAEGTPSWVDLQVGDPQEARGFYAELFGWEVLDGSAEAGGHLMALLDGRPVAGIGPAMSADPAPGVWTTYLAVDDADAVARRAAEAGGIVLAPPFDVMDVGRMAVVADNAGAVFGIWQARAHAGAGIVNEPGALCWSELHTRRYALAQRFYASVFGYRFTEIGDGASFTYSTVSLSDDPAAQIAGAMDDPQLPAGVDGYWMTWFAVADADETAALVPLLGGSLVVEPSDSPFGRMAVVAGTQGETFGVIDLSRRQGA